MCHNLILNNLRQKHLIQPKTQNLIWTLLKILKTVKKLVQVLEILRL